jgi:endonuclease YncB( thermonuclease family)
MAPTAARLIALALPAILFAGSAVADDWLVYVGGGLEPVEDGWAERRGQVVFTQRGGTLVSVAYPDVDLAASAFITWQLNGRRQVPPRAVLPREPGAPATGQPRPEERSATCEPARILGLRGTETLVVAGGETQETVHVACLDAPETGHKFPELGWFGRTTLSAVQLDVRAGQSICLAELDPPQSDNEGHRIVYVTLADGDDYAAKLIGDGLGMLRSGSCSRAADYRHLEDRAIAELRGLWGPMGQPAAMAAIRQADAVGGGPAPPRARATGGG